MNNLKAGDFEGNLSFDNGKLITDSGMVLSTSGSTFTGESPYNANLTTGDNIPATTHSYYYPYDYYQNYYHYYSYPVYITEKSKFEQAFKIVSKLMEKNIIKTLSVKQFIELVNDISKEL